jgi:hypothetical protein
MTVAFTLDYAPARAGRSEWGMFWIALWLFLIMCALGGINEKLDNLCAILRKRGDER